MAKTTTLRSAPTPIPERLFGDVVQECFDRAGDRPTATDALRDLILSDPEVRQLFFDQFLRQACSFAVSSLLRDKRPAADQSKQGRMMPSSTDSRLLDLTDRLMQWPLVNGQALASSRRADVVASEKWYRAQGTTMNNHANWLALISREINDGDVLVGKVMTREKIKSLWDQTHEK